MRTYSTLEIVKRAVAGHYAVPAINVADPLSLGAVVQGADRIGSPLIVQTSVKTVRLFGAKPLAASFRNALRGVDVPVSLHLDHCPDRVVISETIECGWDSVLFDASDRDYDQAVGETSEVVAEAHAAGVDVESEVENIVGVEDGVGSDAAEHAYSIDQLIDGANSCGVDLLAPALGTAHGVYKVEPHLLPERAAAIIAQTDIPLVLHGGTGLSEAEFQTFIEAGVGKINISTALKQAYMKEALSYLREMAEPQDTWEPTKMFTGIEESCEKIVGRFATVFGSKGKA